MLNSFRCYLLQNYESFVIYLILKVVRSSRLRGYLTPSSIHILSNMVSSGHLGSEEVFFVGTNHGKRMMLAQCSHLVNEIYLLVLTPANFNKNQSEEADRNFLNDLYHWELVIRVQIPNLWFINKNTFLINWLIKSTYST